MKVEVVQPDINKLVNVPTNLNSLKTKVNDLDISKWKNFPLDLKTLSNVVDNEVVKNTKLNSRKTKVSNLENKIPDATTLIHLDQYTHINKI